MIIFFYIFDFDSLQFVIQLKFTTLSELTQLTELAKVVKFCEALQLWKLSSLKNVCPKCLFTLPTKKCHETHKVKLNFSMT